MNRGKTYKQDKKKTQEEKEEKVEDIIEKKQEKRRIKCRNIAKFRNKRRVTLK